MLRATALVFSLGFFGYVSAQAPIYGQCGGIGWCKYLHFSTKMSLIIFAFSWRSVFLIVYVYRWLIYIIQLQHVRQVPPAQLATPIFRNACELILLLPDNLLRMKPGLGMDLGVLRVRPRAALPVRPPVVPLPPLPQATLTLALLYDRFSAFSKPY